MVKILLSLLTFAITVSCTNENGSGILSDDSHTAISLSADIMLASVTKSPVEGSKFGSATPAFILTAYQRSSVPVDWMLVGDNGFKGLDVNSNADGVLELSTAKYYPANNLDKLYFYAYSPSSISVADGTAQSAPIASGTINGSDDVMWAKHDVGASKYSQNVSLSFIHLLKQVRFKIVADATFDAGWSLTKLDIKDVKKKITFPLNTGVAVFDYSGSTVDDRTLNFPLGSSSSVPISTTEVALEGSLMFEPGATFTIDIVIKKGLEEVVLTGVEVTLASTPPIVAGGAGVRHEVLLTFARNKVSASSTITDWESAGEGDVTIG